MLTLLRIGGFAIVDQVEVRFGPGLNVLTGETGAGKSLLVNALHLVLGGRMSAEVLRDGADEAVVEALFELPADHPVFARLEAAGRPARAAGGRRRPSCWCGAWRRAAGRGGPSSTACSAPSRCWSRRCGASSTSPASTSTSRSSTRRPTSTSLDAFAGLDGAGGGAPRSSPATARPSGALGARARAGRARGSTRASGPAAPTTSPSSSRSWTRSTRSPGEDAALDGERRVLASAEKLREAARRGRGARLRRGGERQRAGRAGAPRARRRRGARPPARGRPSSCSARRPSSSTRPGASSPATPRRLGGDPERLAGRRGPARGPARRSPASTAARWRRRSRAGRRWRPSWPG